jgi:hypothetical protein
MAVVRIRVEVSDLNCQPGSGHVSRPLFHVSNHRSALLVSVNHNKLHQILQHKPPAGLKVVASPFLKILKILASSSATNTATFLNCHDWSHYCMSHCPDAGPEQAAVGGM